MTIGLQPRAFGAKTLRQVTDIGSFGTLEAGDALGSYDTLSEGRRKGLGAGLPDGEWRVGPGNVEMVTGAGHAPNCRQDRKAQHLRLCVSFDKLSDIPPNKPGSRGVFFDKHRSCRPSGQGLEADGPGTGKKVEEGGIDNLRTKYLKGPLPHRVRSGSHEAVPARPIEPPRPPNSTRDPHGDRVPRFQRPAGTVTRKTSKNPSPFQCTVGT